MDTLIFLDKETREARVSDVYLEREDIILVQAKYSRLGMFLMGHAVFSIELLRKFHPVSIRSIALCTKDDSVLRPLLDPYPEVEVVVIEE